MKAVIYARYSSHAQREESIESQLRVCYEYAERQGIQVLKEYVDKAISGTTDEQPAFQQMIQESSSHAFDAVLLYSVDRFARDRYAAATYRHELKKHGVKSISVTQPLDDSPESILLEAMLRTVTATIFPEMTSAMSLFHRLLLKKVLRKCSK